MCLIYIFLCISFFRSFSDCKNCLGINSEAQVELAMPRKFNLGNIIVSRKKHCTALEKKSLVQLVRSVRPKYPFFVSIMHLTHVSNRCFLVCCLCFMSFFQFPREVLIHMFMIHYHLFVLT